MIHGKASFTPWILCAVLAACSSAPPPAPSNVFIGAHVLPTPQMLGPSALPQIIAIGFNSLDVHRSSMWSGRFVTSTNTASLEVRTNLFSVDVPKTGPGRFAFSMDILDLPPIFVRGYRLRVIARNTQGVASEEDMPFRIR